ncbi:MAG: type ISP restriction/modification enzyme [Janthinobacterium lividum]
MTHFGHYFKSLVQAYAKGDATEHTYRPALKTLLESLAPGIIATNEPKRIKCGAPDYILTRGETPLGYVEAKDVGEPLDKIEKSDQMKRYFGSLGNLILTDYVEFRWYVGGQRRMTARLGTGGGKKPLLAEAGGEAQVQALLEAFLNAEVPTVRSPKELAGRMANLAKLVRETISRALADEDKGGTLHQQFEGFRKTLLHDLTPDAFADMYAQTIAYGLFAARCNVSVAAKPGQRFTRFLAPHQLPKTNPFLRKTFGYIAGPDLDERVVWVVDDLAELLDRADMEAILKDFGHRTRQEDPVVHFYETFLGAYDPKMRQARGVYYTPEPGVSYIVRSVDHLLKTAFGLSEGLADAEKITVKAPDGKGTAEVHRVQILDPATGTGTFLHGVIDHVEGTFTNNKGMWSSYVSEHLLPRLFGFELLMAPYAVAHLKLGLQLAESGYDFESDERLGVFLTNTLEEAAQVSGNLFAQWVVDEANAANEVKQGAPVMVVLGNPPYSGHSANTGKWISGILRGVDTQTGAKTGSYFEVDGKPLGERNPKWINDDYVKFIRFAQWRIEQTGYGILAFITNHGYLDNPTFRGMRQSLMTTFDDIYLLDLHGNSKKKEVAPDGGKDENVFDIQQGVAIGIFVKRPGAAEAGARLHHADLYGSRAHKYHVLLENDVATTHWTELVPEAPTYLFVPQDTDLKAEYEQGWFLTEIMPVFSPGIVTGQDEKAIGFTRKETEALAAEFKLSPDVIQPIIYRPYDKRFVVYSADVVTRPRRQVMRHILSGNNLGIVTTRATKDAWDCGVSTSLIGHKALAAYDINSLFPLYLHPDNSTSGLFSDPKDDTKTLNLSQPFLEDVANRLGITFVSEGHGDQQATYGPEDIIDYLYAIFHSWAYRSRYAEFLKSDFPRLPLTSQQGLFHTLCTLGSELVSLHLMEMKGPATITYPVALPKADSMRDTVETVRYVEPTESDLGRVYINKAQYFEGIPPAVWAFQVGGYQVCQKWLKDRKGRTLTFDDIKHYQGVVAAQGETIRLMAAIDEAIDDYGGWPIR